MVMTRVEHVPPIRFFTPAEAALLAAVTDRVMPQDDRDAAHRIPIVPFIDERLQLGVTDGYRYADMPPDGEAHQLGLVAIEAIAAATYDRAFVALDSTAQDLVLEQIHDGLAPAAAEIWKRMPAHCYWTLLVNDVCHVYYAHPWAWDEIGFGGPAYPRGYMRLERGQREPWEVDEQRYVWEPPPTARSTAFEPVAGADGGGGQGGTH
jgi:hypothetical protein